MQNYERRSNQDSNPLAMASRKMGAGGMLQGRLLAIIAGEHRALEIVQEALLNRERLLYPGWGVNKQINAYLKDAQPEELLRMGRMLAESFNLSGEIRIMPYDPNHEIGGHILVNYEDANRLRSQYDQYSEFHPSDVIEGGSLEGIPVLF